jgi:hypothetical protein
VMHTVPAEIDENGTVTLLRPLPYSSKRRAIVIIFDVGEDAEISLMSEPVLGEDWNHLQEDIAWSHLQLPHIPSAGRTDSG